MNCLHWCKIGYLWLVPYDRFAEPYYVLTRIDEAHTCYWWDIHLVCVRFRCIVSNIQYNKRSHFSRHADCNHSNEFYYEFTDIIPTIVWKWPITTFQVFGEKNNISAKTVGIRPTQFWNLPYLTVRWNYNCRIIRVPDMFIFISRKLSIRGVQLFY